jgi:3,4-dihydroxy 2-butanone 4-phosphate synthase/GTP cyclohydrolase II
VQVYISDLVQYRLEYESLIQQTSKKNSVFFGKKANKIVFSDNLDNKFNVISFGKINSNCNVKFHKTTSDYDLMCDKQAFDDLKESILYLQKNDGVLIFLPQVMQNDDNAPLKKNFGIGAGILREMGVKNINLLSHKTNSSYAGLQGFGLEIVKQISI